MRPITVLLTLTLAAAAPLGLAGCGNDEAEASPPRHDTEGDERAPFGEVPEQEQTDEPLTPGADGVIEPEEGQVVMPPDVVPEAEGNLESDGDPLPRANDPTTPDARDQLERDLVEEGRPQ